MFLPFSRRYYDFCRDNHRYVVLAMSSMYWGKAVDVVSAVSSWCWLRCPRRSVRDVLVVALKVSSW